MGKVIDLRDYFTDLQRRNTERRYFDESPELFIPEAMQDGFERKLPKDLLVRARNYQDPFYFTQH